MAACVYCNSSIATNASVCGSCGMPVREPIQGTLATGTVLRSSYRIQSVLGQGGFGITYRALHQALDLPVAVKELFPDGSVREGSTIRPSASVSRQEWVNHRKDFIEEGRHIARFNHPSIVKVQDVFEENGTAYLVMEMLSGETLGEALKKRGRLPAADVVTLGVKVCEGLEVVHKAGLLHRDVKPDNVFLTKDGRAVLLDFGSAREFQSGKTVKHTRLVTADYAPPEQWSSQARFGPYTDVYALAATLYQAVNGAPPPQATDRLMENPPRDLPIAAGLPPGLRAALTQGLRLRIEDRPQGAGDFSRLLRATQPSIPSPSFPSRTPQPRGPSPTPAPQPGPQPPTPRPSPPTPDPLSFPEPPAFGSESTSTNGSPYRKLLVPALLVGIATIAPIAFVLLRDTGSQPGPAVPPTAAAPTVSPTTPSRPGRAELTGALAEGGFRDVRFGTPPSSDMLVTEERFGSATAYRRPADDTSSLLGTPLSAVRYCFLDGKFVAVFAVLSIGAEKEFLAVAKDVFGAPQYESPASVWIVTSGPDRSSAVLTLVPRSDGRFLLVLCLKDAFGAVVTDVPDQPADNSEAAKTGTEPQPAETPNELQPPATPVSRDRSTARTANVAGLKSSRAGKYDDAAGHFRKGIAADPLDVEIWNNLGYAFMMLGRLQEAEEALLQAIRLAPERSAAWAVLATVHARLDRAEEAVADLRRVYGFSRNREKTLAYLRLRSANPETTAAERTAIAEMLRQVAQENEAPAEGNRSAVDGSKTSRPSVDGGLRVTVACPIRAYVMIRVDGKEVLRTEVKPKSATETSALDTGVLKVHAGSSEVAVWVTAVDGKSAREYDLATVSVEEGKVLLYKVSLDQRMPVTRRLVTESIRDAESK